MIIPYRYCNVQTRRAIRCHCGRRLLSARWRCHSLTPASSHRWRRSKRLGQTAGDWPAPGTDKGDGKELLRTLYLLFIHRSPVYSIRDQTRAGSVSALATLYVPCFRGTAACYRPVCSSHGLLWEWSWAHPCHCASWERMQTNRMNKWDRMRLKYRNSRMPVSKRTRAHELEFK